MNTNKLLFQPWKGKNYDNSMFDIPVLIVGESNYGVSQGKEKDATFTHQLINSIIDGSWKHLFFSNIQRTFVENADTQHSRNEFWHSVAHYEYIQEWMPCSGVRPTKEMWMNAKPYFEEVVSELNPKCILFVCKRVYDRITSDFPSGELLNSDSGNRTTIKIQNAHATYVKHPTRYGFRKSREVVSKLIQISGGKSRV